MKSFGKRVLEFTAGTGISRITGLGREIMMAYLFGVSKLTDSFLVAFTIPNLLRDLFAESALSASFIPILAKKAKKERKVFAYQIFHLLLFITGFLTIIGMIFAPYIVKLMAYGFNNDPERLSLTISLTRWMFPFLILVSISAWAMGIINTHHHFFIPSVASTGFNIGTIVITLITYTYFYLHGPSAIHSMALGVLVGGLLQFVIQIPTLFKYKFGYKPYFSFWNKDIKRAIKLWLPVTFGFAFTRINVAVDTFLISFLKTGAVSYIKYGYRVMHLPLGLFGIAVGVVALPSLAESVKDINELTKRLKEAFSFSLLLSIPSAIFLVSGSITSIDLLFRYGKFSINDSINTAWALGLYSVSIPAFAIIKSINSLYYAFENTKTPMILSGIGVLLNIVLNLSLMKIMGFKAFPLATSISNSFVMLSLILILKKKYGILPSSYIEEPLKLILVSLIAGTPVFFISLWKVNNIGLRIFKLFSSLFIFIVSFIFIISFTSEHYKNYLKKFKIPFLK